MKIGVMVDYLAAMRQGVVPVNLREVEFDPGKSWAKETVELISRYCRVDSSGEIWLTIPVLTATTAGVIEAVQRKREAEQAEADRISALKTETGRAIEALDLELVEIDLYSTPQLMLTRATGANWSREIANEICKDFPDRVKFIADRQAFLKSEKDRADAEAARRSQEELQARQQAVADWIEASGSELLKRRFELDCDWSEMYRSERIAKELPGWKWYSDFPGRLDEPRSPELEDFQLVDRARQQIPDAILRWLHRADQHVASGEFLDELVVFTGDE